VGVLQLEGTFSIVRTNLRPWLKFYRTGGGLFYVKIISIVVFPLALRPDYGSRSPVGRLRDHTLWTHHTR
jgi:hypothetical protein